MTETITPETVTDAMIEAGVRAWHTLPDLLLDDLLREVYLAMSGQSQPINPTEPVAVCRAALLEAAEELLKKGELEAWLFLRAKAGGDHER